MPDFRITPLATNGIIDAFGLGKIKYKVIQGVSKDLETLGVRPAFTLATEFALQNIYKPIMSKNARLYEESLTQKDNNKIKSGVNNFMKGTGDNQFVFSSLKFKDSIDYKSKQKITMENNFIPCCLFSTTQTKNIVKTAVLNRSGSIKEYISDGDYMINAKLVVTGSNGIYPFDKVKNLVSFLNQPTELEIDSPYLNNILGVTYLVVESWDMPQTEGGISQQAFNINFSSDVPFLLEEIGLIEQVNQVIGGGAPSM